MTATPPGVISYVAYGWEGADTYGTVSTSIGKAFGHGVKTPTLSRKNNIEKVYSQGYRVAQKLISKKFEGAITVESVLANPWFFRAVLGTTSSSGSGPYTHTFTEADTIPSISIKNDLQLSADCESVLLGGVVNICTISSVVNELVRVRLDTGYANETLSTTTSAKVADSFDLFTFAHGTLEVPNATPLALVQNFEATISTNAEIIAGQGSRLGQAQVGKGIEHNGTISMAMSATADLLEKCLGSATGPSSTSVDEVATLEMTFTNGSTGTSARSIAMLWTGVQLDEESLPQDPTAVIMEDVTWTARTLTVTAVNNTQTSA